MSTTAEPTRRFSPPVGAALRRAFSKKYGLAELRADILAGLVVGIVAIPLSMALAIAVGVAPEHGLYTAVVAGAVVALLGGCKFQVTGPTAAFIVVLAPIVARHGLGGLLTAGVLAGAMLVVMGVARLGTWIQYIPYPVTTGFTTGIAIVIATLQLKDVLGLDVGPMPESFVEKVAVLWEARATVKPFEFGAAALTFTLLLVLPKVLKAVPAPLLAIAVVSALGAVVHHVVPGMTLATIGSRFHSVVDGVEVAGIPSALPSFAAPWGSEPLTWTLLRELLPAAFAIAMLGAIESLLSAVIADGMTHTKHDSNSELVALGVGNIFAPFFGGIAATGALARTATNIRAGAKSPIAAVTHSAFVLLAILLLAPLVAHIPMASLAALLLLVAWNMSEARHFAGLVKAAPKSDVLVLVTCCLLTVFFDMVVAVFVGVVLAAALFVRRMAELTESRLQLDSSTDDGGRALPEGVVLYDINGPLFFGASNKAMQALHSVSADDYRVLIVHLGRVPVIDATGLVALEAALQMALGPRRHVVVAGPFPKPDDAIPKAALETKHERLMLAPDLDSAIRLAEELVTAHPPSSPPPAA
ncbi:MAG: C4-dicarboxylic acid transporter DauA [Polyangiales bacterium]